MPPQSHLTLTERSTIERMLTYGYSFIEIAENLNKHPSTISREVKKNRDFILSRKGLRGKCANSYGCPSKWLCGNLQCHRYCKDCDKIDCRTLCSKYQPRHCELLDKPPYVCNKCPKQEYCSKECLLLKR
jgi:hypothetical protein